MVIMLLKARSSKEAGRVYTGRSRRAVSHNSSHCFDLGKRTVIGTDTSAASRRGRPVGRRGDGWRVRCSQAWADANRFRIDRLLASL